jgi:hypothetical protein
MQGATHHCSKRMAHANMNQRMNTEIYGFTPSNTEYATASAITHREELETLKQMLTAREASPSYTMTARTERTNRSARSSRSDAPYIPVPRKRDNPFSHFQLMHEYTARGSRASNQHKKTFETATHDACNPIVWDPWRKEIFPIEWDPANREPLVSTEITQYTEAVVRQGLSPFATK